MRLLAHSNKRVETLNMFKNIGLVTGSCILFNCSCFFAIKNKTSMFVILFFISFRAQWCALQQEALGTFYDKERMSWLEVCPPHLSERFEIKPEFHFQSCTRVDDFLFPCSQSYRRMGARARWTPIHVMHEHSLLQFARETTARSQLERYWYGWHCVTFSLYWGALMGTKQKMQYLWRELRRVSMWKRKMLARQRLQRACDMHYGSGLFAISDERWSVAMGVGKKLLAHSNMRFKILADIFIIICSLLFRVSYLIVCALSRWKTTPVGYVL